MITITITITNDKTKQGWQVFAKWVFTGGKNRPGKNSFCHHKVAKIGL